MLTNNDATRLRSLIDEPEWIRSLHVTLAGAVVMDTPGGEWVVAGEATVEATAEKIRELLQQARA